MAYHYDEDCDCETCEETRESELKQKPEVLACADLVRKVYEFHPAGADLHCIIDDGNVDCLIDPDDDWIGECRRRKEPLRKKRQTYAGLERAERACMKAMADLTVDERLAAVNLAHSG